jgi:hypothetical protein
MTRVKYKQSLFDITVQKFGRIDELINVSNDNSLSISELLETSQEIIIENYKGNEKVKNAIALQNITLNNNADFEAGVVIVNRVLENGDNKIFENGNNHISE